MGVELKEVKPKVIMDKSVSFNPIFFFLFSSLHLECKDLKDVNKEGKLWLNRHKGEKDGR